MVQQGIDGYSAHQGGGVDRRFTQAWATIESSFRPLSCRISLDLSSVGIRIYDADTGEAQLFVAGIHFHRLATARDIGRLVDELRHELEIISLSNQCRQAS